MKPRNARSTIAMTDLPHTRAHEQAPDGRASFALDQTDAQELWRVSTPPSDGSQARMDLVYRDRLNQWWLEAGQRLGFIWSTVDHLHWSATPRDDAGETQIEDVTGASFTAQPHPVVEPVASSDALAWIKQRFDDREGATIETFKRGEVVAAYDAGRDTGYAMGAAEAEVQLARVRVLEGQMHDAAELLRESSDAMVAMQKWPDESSDHDLPQRISAFLAEPSQGRIAHDGLREAREDAANGVVAGWTAAISAAGAMLEQMAVNLLAPDPNGFDEGNRAYELRCAKSGLDMLPQPADLDELLNPWRGVMFEIAQIARLRGPKPAWAVEITGGGWSHADHVHWAAQATQAWLDHMRRTEWVREAVTSGSLKVMVPKALGMHTDAVIMELLNWSNTATEAALKAVDGLQSALGDALDMMTRVSSLCMSPTDTAMYEHLRTLTEPMAGVEQAQVDALHQAYHAGGK